MVDGRHPHSHASYPLNLRLFEVRNSSVLNFAAMDHAEPSTVSRLLTSPLVECANPIVSLDTISKFPSLIADLPNPCLIHLSDDVRSPDSAAKRLLRWGSGDLVRDLAQLLETKNVAGFSVQYHLPEDLSSSDANIAFGLAREFSTALSRLHTEFPDVANMAMMYARTRCQTGMPLHEDFGGASIAERIVRLDREARSTPAAHGINVFKVSLPITDEELNVVRNELEEAAAQNEIANPPALIAAGGPAKSESMILDNVRRARRAGWNGVAIGRTYFEADDVGELARKVIDSLFVDQQAVITADDDRTLAVTAPAALTE